jgi:hypothetical protein
VDITGFGLGRFGVYNITLSGVSFNGYSNSEIESVRAKDQASMVRTNENLPLTFPYTLQALLEFVDGSAGQIGGRHFSFPKGFREAAAVLTQPFKAEHDESKTQRSAIDAANINELPDDWISKAQDKAQELGLLKWKDGIRQITARGMCEAVSTALGKDQATWGKQGPRSSDNVRGKGLRGWKFTPPIEGKTVD